MASDENDVATVTNPIERMRVDQEPYGGRACIRGLRVRVSNFLDLLAAGLDPQQVPSELPNLEAEDISALCSTQHGHRDRSALRKPSHPSSSASARIAASGSAPNSAMLCW